MRLGACRVTPGACVWGGGGGGEFGELSRVTLQTVCCVVCSKIVCAGVVKLTGQHSEHRFVIQLNEPSDFDGGGTTFQNYRNKDEAELVCKLKRGGISLHPGFVSHGVPPSRRPPSSFDRWSISAYSDNET